MSVAVRLARRITCTVIAPALVAVVPRDAASQWRVDPQPMLTIGSASEGDEYLFSRIHTVTRASDGTIVVVDADMTTVRVFDARGRFVRQIGAKGRGPGEYSFPYWAGVTRGDTILLYDYNEGPGRLNWFAPSGAFARSVLVSLGQDASPANPIRLLAGGSLIFTGHVRSSYAPGRERPYRGESSVMHFVPPETRTLLMKFPGQIVTGPRSTPWVVDGVAAASDSLLYVGDGETTTISVHGFDGGRRRSIALPVAPLAVTAADRTAWRTALERLAEERPARRNSIVAQIARTDFPSHYPPYNAWLTDSDGNLWVGLWRGHASTGGAEYLVYDERLQLLSRVRFPEGFHPREIGREHVLGIARDDDDVPQVRMYRLVRPRAP